MHENLYALVHDLEKEMNYKIYESEWLRQK